MNADVERLPLRIIEPRTGWTPIDWRELWEYRELLGFLVWRDAKVRYKQTVLGAAWAILQPLMTMILFTLLFGRWAKMPSDGVPYSLFAFAGLIPWTFFANSLASASTSLVGNTHLISKVYFPRLLISLSSLGTGVLDLLVALVVMLAMLVLSGTPLTWRLATLPAVGLLTLFIAFAAGSALAALNVMYRDIRYVVPFVTQFWMFASPVIYPVRLVPDRWRWAFYLNPMVGAIDGFRAALLGTPLDIAAIGCSVAVTLVMLWAGLAYFHRIESRIADLV
jgi:lipopolysaccharide transport system permease protein